MVGKSEQVSISPLEDALFGLSQAADSLRQAAKRIIDGDNAHNAVLIAGVLLVSEQRLDSVALNLRDHFGRKQEDAAAPTVPDKKRRRRTARAPRASAEERTASLPGTNPTAQFNGLLDDQGDT